MHELSPPDFLPKAGHVGQQPEECVCPLGVLDPRRPIWSIDLDESNCEALPLKRITELTR